MADNDVDGGLSEGTAGQPTQQSSGGNGGSSGSFDAAKLQSLIEGFGKRIEEIDARTKSLQGDKDRGVSKATKEIESLKTKIAEYEKLKSKGMHPDEALEEMDFRQTVRQLQSQLSGLGSAQAQPAGTGASPTVDAAQTIKDYGLDANDPAVVPMLSLKGADLKAAAADLAFRRARQPAPDPSAASSIAGGQHVSKDVESLTNEFTQKMRSARGNKSELQRLKEEYRQKGVNIFNIDFT